MTHAQLTKIVLSFMNGEIDIYQAMKKANRSMSRIKFYAKSIKEKGEISVNAYLFDGNSEKFTDIIRKYVAGEITTDEAMKLTGRSRVSVYKYKKNFKDTGKVEIKKNGRRKVYGSGTWVANSLQYGHTTQD
jgi:hypothetical protein